MIPPKSSAARTSERAQREGRSSDEQKRPFEIHDRRHRRDARPERQRERGFAGRLPASLAGGRSPPADGAPIRGPVAAVRQAPASTPQAVSARLSPSSGGAVFSRLTISLLSALT